MTYKIGLLETTLFRRFSRCSSYEKLHEEIVKAKEIFKRTSNPFSLNGSYASFDDFETLVKESDEFRLHLRKLLLIVRDDPPLNRNVKSFHLKFFDNYL